MKTKLTITTPDVYELDRDGFISLLAERTTPKDVFEKAGAIYEYLEELMHQRCFDSLLREWSFQWATKELGIEYDAIYEKWLRECWETTRV